MKNYLIGLFSVAVLVTSLQSCNEDIILTGDFEETAIVYGLIDQSDSVHLLKITRAYIGPGNSLTYAQIPDSNYFPSVVATITEKVGLSVGRTWTLFDTIILNKSEDGIFYAPEQKLYAFYTNGMDNSDSPTGEPINPNATYALHIDINNGQFIVEGETEIVTGISSAQANPTSHFNFAKNANATGEFEVSSLNVSSGNSKLMNASLVLNYKEFIGAAMTERSVNWNLGERQTELGSNELFTMNGEVFYDILANDCSNADPLIDKRNFGSITVKVVGGSEDLNNYILVNQPSSSLAQNKPSFTNLTVSGDHQVIGLFSSRYTYARTIPFNDLTNQWVRCLNANSTMELCVGAITGPYLFCSDHTYDIGQALPYICQ